MMPFRLILAPRVWQTEFSSLLATGTAGAALLNRNPLGGTTELVARSLLPIREGTTGRDFGSLDELLLVDLAEDVGPQDTMDRIERFQPQPGQLVAALRLGYGRGEGRWTGSVRETGRYFRLDELRLVGSGMRQAMLDPLPVEPPAGERGSRTRGALGDAAWHKLRGSRVAVIGASRNGSVVAVTLAMLGVGSITLVDPDRDEAHGLDAILGALPGGVGHPKVLNRREALLRIRPGDLEIHPLALPFPDPRVSDRLRDVDLICTCVDRDAARLAAAQFANRWCKLHLDIGTGIFGSGADRIMGGDIRLLLPGQACVVCLGGLRDPGEAEYEVSGPPGALRRGPRPTWNQQRSGSLVTLNSIACNLGVQMYLDLLAGRVTESRWCHVEFTADGRATVTDSSKTAEPCTVCRGTWRG